MSPSNADLAAAVVAKVRHGMRASYDQSKGPTLSLEPRQRQSRIDRGASPSVLTSQVVLPPPPESDVKDALLAAISSLGDAGRLPPLEASSVSLEWVAIRRGNATVDEDCPMHRYNALTQGTTSPVTIIFVHGGAFL